ncbi:thioredoxin-like protein [Trichoderma sp. SZMC 28013]
MPIKIHGPRSTSTKRVLLVLEEKQVPYEVITSTGDTAEARQHPDFLKLQPFAKVPVLEDDGVFIFESRAICKYIAKKYAAQGTKLIPDEGDLVGYGLFEQACSIEQNYFNEPTEGLASEKVFKPHLGGTTNDARVKELETQLNKTLAVYNNILGKHKYLTGDEISLADLFHLPYGQWARKIGYKETFEKYPNVERWFASLEARESWVKVQ